MKAVNNIDEPERARGDNNNKAIGDVIFEDFSTTPFNSPIVSPESKLRNLERNPLFISLKKPKRYYSRKFKEKAKSNLEEKFKAAIEDNMTLVSANQCKTGISKNYHWDEDDNDFFASISTQEILDQNRKVNNNVRSISKFPNLMLRETNVALGLQKTSGKQPELGEGKNAVGLNEIFIENEWEEVKNKMHQDELGKFNNPASSFVSAGLQTIKTEKKPSNS
ncbi:hypothetical protein GQX74_013880 [Glossina fuscipes]|nr:hypothetical protein GQX74_013880 [Glossina fuscipes]